MNLGIGLGVTNYLRVPTVALDPDAAIAALFESGEVGAWYDPSDSTTVFQDYFGTTAATVGSPVGLILDKSQGLTANSPEIFDGVFETIEDWTNNGDGSWSVSSAGTNLDLRTFPGMTLGKNYVLTFDLTITSGQVIAYNAHTAPNIYTTTSGAKKVIQVSATQTWILFRAFAGTTATISNISSKELPGNHATQTTSSARPVLQQSGDLYYLDFDGVDDSLSTAAVDFTATDAISTFVGVTGDSPRTNNSRIFIVSSDLTWSATDGGCSIMSGDGSTDSVRALLYGASINQTTRVSDSFPYTRVLTALFDAGAASAADEISFRADGAVIDTGSATDSGITSFGLQQIYISKYATASSGYFGGRIYGLVIRGATSDSAEVSDAETYLAAKSGVTL